MTKQSLPSVVTLPWPGSRVGRVGRDCDGASASCSRLSRGISIRNGTSETRKCVLSLLCGVRCVTLGKEEEQEANDGLMGMTTWGFETATG